jgi:shikimate dehydrogenase
VNVADHKLLVGLIGAGIQASLSPALHEEEARHHGLQLHYQLIDLDVCGASAASLPMLLEAARIMGFVGLNITYPFKQAIVPRLDALSPEAQAMRAVNTVVIREGRWVGHNTDGAGWAWGFQRALPHADRGCVVLLGAGGAGSAIADAALRLGVGELRLVDQDPARALALADSLRTRHGLRVTAFFDAPTALDGATGLIHATPTGMAKLPGMPIPVSLLHCALWVSEVVYFPIETELLKAARAIGCDTIDGGTMAVGQAAGAFELFTGCQAHASRMDRHFRRLVAGR